MPYHICVLIYFYTYILRSGQHLMFLQTAEGSPHDQGPGRGRGRGRNGRGRSRGRGMLSQISFVIFP